MRGVLPWSHSLSERELTLPWVLSFARSIMLLLSKPANSKTQKLDNSGFLRRSSTSVYWLVPFSPFSFDFFFGSGLNRRPNRRMGRWAASFPTRTRACPTTRVTGRGFRRKLPAVKSSKSFGKFSVRLCLNALKLLRNRPGLLCTGYVVAGFRPHHGPHTRQLEPSRVPAPA